MEQMSPPGEYGENDQGRDPKSFCFMVRQKGVLHQGEKKQGFRN